MPQTTRDNRQMASWPDRRLLDLLNLDLPIIQAPMAGADSVALARSVCSTGALGSLAAALLDADGVRAAVRGVEGVSFHFGLPAPELVQRLKARGLKILSSATSVAEARWLEERGCDAVIVQGYEAGGHRAMFLETDVAAQVGLFALLPQVADAVSVPVIAAGGIGDARGVVAALALGASGVQMGTAYLFCPEANVSAGYRQALRGANDTGTAVTNLFSGRPARGMLNRYLRETGPMSARVLAFPHAATMVAPLRAASEKAGSLDYLQLWAGQAARLTQAQALPADQFTRKLAADALSRLQGLPV